MIVDVEMPHQGLTLTEAVLLRWLKHAGDRVEKDEGFFEIETEKAVQEVVSPASGTVLALLAEEGDLVPLGEIVAKISTEVADHLGTTDSISIAASAPAAVAPLAASAAPAPTENARARTEVAASPRAKRAAARRDVDLATVQPTGAGGQHIREQDVLRAEAQQAALPMLAAGAPAAPSRVRRTIAERAAASFRDVPHFYLSREISAERLLAFRQQLLADLDGDAPVRISITDLLIKALALALKAFPILNAQWHDGAIVALPTIDIGLAVDTPRGLLVPVIRNADALALTDIAAQRASLAQRAKEGKAKPEELTGGSMTLSNLGGFDIDHFQAIINPPQSGILAVGAIKARPFVVDGQLAVCNTVMVTLSIDHRVTDGADGARFLQRFVELLEKPLRLCLPSYNRVS